MKIFPAIDLINGKAVRLFQGDYRDMTVYSENPVDVAAGFYETGAKFLHIVDLDGAKDGNLVNFDIVKKIVKQCNMFVEIGGGIRDEERIKRYLDAGVGRVILGTVAAQNPDFAKEMSAKYGENIAVGVDVKDGKVAVKGWCEVTDLSGIEFCESLVKGGVKTIIYTDISKDGAMTGTNVDAYKEISSIEGINLIASGGISSEEEIGILKDIVDGAILGKALYDGVLNLKTCIDIAGEQ